jgi:FKBP-type peptidyl-prolyl cis-trans isomerase
MRASSSATLSFSIALILACTAFRADAQRPPAGALSAQPAAAAPSQLILPPAPPDVAQPPADAEKTESGLVTKVLAKGTGDKKPGPGDIATFNYTAWAASDGKAFDSSLRRGRPSSLFLDRVMPGLSEAMQMMVAGEKRRVWVPESLAFKGEPGRPAGTLVFDVELVSFDPSPRVPPLDVMAAPPDATKLPSGLAFRVLRPGTGTVSPKKTSRVTVHYTGWTTDGQMFDSSVARGQPVTLGLDEVIKGWTEGVSLMVEGEKRRFWIPARLAYGNEDGKPKGMLVFDVELVKIDKM